MLVGSTGSVVMLVGGVAPATYCKKKKQLLLTFFVRGVQLCYILIAIRFPLAEDFLLDTLHS